MEEGKYHLVTVLSKSLFFSFNLLLTYKVGIIIVIVSREYGNSETSYGLPSFTQLLSCAAHISTVMPLAVGGGVGSRPRIPLVSLLLSLMHFLDSFLFHNKSPANQTLFFRAPIKKKMSLRKFNTHIQSKDALNKRLKF